MGYLYEDGTPDDEESILLSARVFAVALGEILKANISESRRSSGVVVHLPYQAEYPDDPHGVYAAVLDGDLGQIVLHDLNDEDVKPPHGTYITLDPSVN